MHISIGYFLINRGRYEKEIVKNTLQFIDNNPHFILLTDESDATDRHKGLDGRKPLTTIQNERKDIHVYMDKDLDVGINFIHSPSIKPQEIQYTQINKLNLILPQGSSEHYKHHRLTAIFDLSENLQFQLGIKGLIIVAQHNSAFIRPFTRIKQSFDAMTLTRKLQYQNPNYLAILIRDQNTFIPGEGRMERILRFIFEFDAVTDKAKRIYNIDKLETDTGGLNRFAGWFNRIGGFKFLRKIITIADKIETMSIIKGKDKELNLKLTPDHIHLDSTDHGLLSLKIERNLDKK